MLLPDWDPSKFKSGGEPSGDGASKGGESEIYNNKTYIIWYLHKIMKKRLWNL